MRSLWSLGAAGIVVLVLGGACTDADDGQGATTSTPGLTTTTVQQLKPIEPAADPCVGLDASDPVPVVADLALTEISGAVVSRRTDDAVWVHEDSGNSAVVTEIGLDGVARSRWSVPGVDAVDWEDMAGATSADGIRYLFIGDIGDNLAVRPHVELLRVREPGDAEGGLTDPPAVIQMTLPDGPADAEALLVDPESGDVVMLTKSITGVAQVLVGSRTAWLEDGSVVEMTAEGVLRLGPGQAVLAADLSPDGSNLAVRTPARVLLWQRPPGLSLSATLLDSEPCRAPAVLDIFGEALALTDVGYVLVGEGAAASLIVVR